MTQRPTDELAVPRKDRLKEDTRMNLKRRRREEAKRLMRKSGARRSNDIPSSASSWDSRMFFVCLCFEPAPLKALPSQSKLIRYLALHRGFVKKEF